LQVVSTRQAFSSIKGDEGLRLLGVEHLTSNPRLFTAPPLEMTDSIAPAIAEIMKWTNVGVSGRTGLKKQSIRSAHNAFLMIGSHPHSHDGALHIVL
jgi:hypothetical protein